MSYQVINGHPFLKQPKAEDAPYAILGIIIVVMIPYLLGTRIGVCSEDRAFGSFVLTSTNKIALVPELWRRTEA